MADVGEPLLIEEGKEAILRLYTQASSYAAGRKVTAGGIEGTTDGLDASGFLWVRRKDGKRQLVIAGDVRPL